MEVSKLKSWVMVPWTESTLPNSVVVSQRGWLIISQ
jgi:hypothetical protein